MGSVSDNGSEMGRYINDFNYKETKQSQFKQTKPATRPVKTPPCSPTKTEDRKSTVSQNFINLSPEGNDDAISQGEIKIRKPSFEFSKFNRERMNSQDVG